MIHNQTSQLDTCDLRDSILLNTGSTIGATVCNPKFITNVKPTDEILHMTTNAGCNNVDQKGDVLGLGKAWFNPKFITNIFGFSHLLDLGYAILPLKMHLSASILITTPLNSFVLRKVSTSTNLPKIIFRLLPTRKIMVLRATHF